MSIANSDIQHASEIVTLSPAKTVLWVLFWDYLSLKCSPATYKYAKRFWTAKAGQVERGKLLHKPREMTLPVCPPIQSVASRLKVFQILQVCGASGSRSNRSTLSLNQCNGSSNRTSVSWSCRGPSSDRVPTARNALRSIGLKASITHYYCRR